MSLTAFTVRKRRHPLVAGVLTYDLDLFEDALTGLALVEIKWPDDAGLRTLLAPPGTVREVSDDPRFQGGVLATMGIPEN